MNKIYLFLFLWLGAVNKNIHAQQIKFDHLTVEQGLSQGNVNVLLEDKFGFIWIGTEDGLNLFDGYTFKIFRNTQGDSTSISNNNIRSITEDRAGNLWIGTRNGLNYYNRSTNTFIRYHSKVNGGGSISNNEINCTLIDHNNSLWVGTVNGLNQFDSVSQTFICYYHTEKSNSVISNNISAIIQDKSNRYWIGTPAGLSLLSSDKNTFTHFVHDPANTESLNSNNIKSLYFDRDETTLWIGTFNRGLNKLNIQKKTFTHFEHQPENEQSIGNAYIYSMAESKDGNFWIATDGALSLMDITKGTFTNYRYIHGDNHSLSSNIVTFIYVDRSNRLWVCTRFGGVNVYDKGKYGFRHFKQDASNQSSITSNTVMNFDEDKQHNLYIATDGGGLNYFNPTTNTFIEVSSSTKQGGLSSNKTLAVEIDRNENVWVGTWAGGLNKYNPNTKQNIVYKNIPGNARSLSDNSIFDLLEDSRGNIWIATFGNGISKYHAATNDFTQYTNNPADSNSISAGIITFLLEDKAGTIWIGTENDGLNSFDPNTGIFKHYRESSTYGSLSSNSIASIFEDSKQRLWIGTNGGGLNLYNREKNKFTNYRMDEGLPNDAIMGILEDNQGNIWLSSFKGVCRLDSEIKKIKTFTTSDGLQGNQFNRWAAFKTSSGELLFGGTSGFNIFNPGDIKDNNFIPPVYITEFLLFNKPVAIGANEILNKNILLTKQIKLSHDQNIFSFEFTALNFRQPEKNQYKYIMEGFQDEWIEAGTERKISYTNLNPGDYVFKVIASNNDGVWNTTGTSIAITIVPPFWKTRWFLSITAFSIVGLIIYYNRRLKRQAKQQKIELERIIDEQTSEVKKQNAEIKQRADAERLQNWITQGLAKVGEIISKNNADVNNLSHEVLKNIIQYTGAQIGLIAITNKEDEHDKHLKVLASIGSSKSLNNIRIEIGSGLIGATYQDGVKKIIDNVPENYAKIQSGLGQHSPTLLILLPLTTDDGDTLGIMELAFLTRPKQEVHEFLDNVAGIIALNIHATQLSYKTSMLLRRAREQTEELHAQEEEMRQNMEELEATQEEFRRRELEYQRKIETLEKQLKNNMP